jgi:hypothetical protein
MLRPLLVVAALVVVALVAVRITQPSTPAPTPEPGPVSAIEACHLPGSDVKGGGTYQWQLVVRLDSPQESDLVFLSGSDRVVCQTYRDSDGTFDVSSTSGGGYEATAGNVLTYDIGGLSDSTYSAQLVGGQVPYGTASVDVVTTDGDHHAAAVANGWYLGWATTIDPTDGVVEIDARDSTGKVIARLADPSGLQAGGSAAPAST